MTHLVPSVAVAWLVALLILGAIFRRDLFRAPQQIKALQKLNERDALHDPTGMYKILIVLAGIVLLFFSHDALHLKPAAIALGGAAVALVWGQPDVDEALRHVEWGVLLFFAALFVTTGGLEAAGVLHRLAEAIAGLTRANLLAASLVLLWVAALVSAIVDNIPFTIAMIPIISDLGGLGVNVLPLWWALALGAGFGGNGTPIGATANVITVAMSTRTRTPITTGIWLRSGLPVMVATCIVASVLFVLFFGPMKTP